VSEREPRFCGFRPLDRRGLAALTEVLLYLYAASPSPRLSNSTPNANRRDAGDDAAGSAGGPMTGRDSFSVKLGAAPL
jgi:hypothetical protein